MSRQDRRTIALRGSSAVRARLAATLLGASLGLAPSGGAAADAADGTEAAAPQRVVSFAPFLHVGLGWVLVDGIALGGDVGFRLAHLTGRFAYQVETVGDDYLEYASGRLGWIFAEGKWFAGHAGLGAGRLVRGYGDGSPPRASGTALSGELGLLFAPGWGGGPVVALHLEGLVPLSRAPAPRAGALAAPTFGVIASVNVLALLIR
jgi:hypothetical protein